MTQNSFVSSIKFVAVELIGEIVYFPIWWYTRGAKKFFLFFWQKIVNAQRALGVGIWLTHLWKPMYAQADWQGKLISFLMRIFQIIVRSLALAIVFVVIIILFVIWMILPLLVIYQLYINVINFNL